MNEIIRAMAERQGELWRAMIISNGLAVSGRLIEIGIAVMLALVLARLNDLCRKDRS